MWDYRGIVLRSSEVSPSDALMAPFSTKLQISSMSLSLWES